MPYDGGPPFLFRTSSQLRRNRAATPVTPDSDLEPAPRKAGLFQVAKTMFFGLFAIGMKGTIEKNGAKVTPAQIVIGAFIGGVVLVILIITVVHFVLKLAGPGA